MQVELDAEARNYLTAYAYRQWAIEYELLRLIKIEKNDGSNDWLQFYHARLKKATENEAVAKRVLDQISPFAPLVLGY